MLFRLRCCSKIVLSDLSPVGAFDKIVLIAWIGISSMVTVFGVIICLIQRMFAVWTVCACVYACVCLCVRESLGHAAILHYFSSSLCACVYILVSLPQMMTLSAACPRSALAEAAGTVWWAVGAALHKIYTDAVLSQSLQLILDNLVIKAFSTISFIEV